MFDIISFVSFISYCYFAGNFGYHPDFENKPIFPIETFLESSLNYCDDSRLLEMTKRIRSVRAIRYNSEILRIPYLAAGRKGNYDAYWELSRLYMPGRRNEGVKTRYKARLYLLISQHLRTISSNQSTQLMSDIFGIQEYMTKGFLSQKDEELAKQEFEKWRNENK